MTTMTVITVIKKGERLREDDENPAESDADGMHTFEDSSQMP